MSNDVLTRFDDALDGRVEALREGTTVALTWFRPASTTGVEMARFDMNKQLLSIFPKVGSDDGLTEQFRQVREFQIDTTVWEWDATSPVQDNDRGQLELVGLPQGFGRIFSFGLGFPRAYRGLVHAVEDQSECTVIRFGPPEDEGAKEDVFHISLGRFARYKRAVDLHKARGSTVVGRINRTAAHNEIADITGTARQQLVLGRLGEIQAMTRAISDETPLNAKERSALVARLEAESKQIAMEQPQAFGKLREDLELVTLEVLIEDFREGLTGKGAKNEDVWQQFFTANTFALKQIFATPLAFYGEQIYVRIPDMKGAGGQIADFVLANTLTRSTVLVEIKTPGTALIAQRPYRGASSAEVYPPDKELSGAIAQLQAQMESAGTHFDQIVRNTIGAEPIDTRFMRGAVIAGTLDAMEGPLRKDSFERYRNGLHGIEIITFDEVLERLVELHTMLKNSPNKLAAGRPES